jgi:hypothetical protein
VAVALSAEGDALLAITNGRAQFYVSAGKVTRSHVRLLRSPSKSEK